MALRMSKYWIVISALTLLSCEVNNPIWEGTNVVVEGFLISGSRFEKVRLRRVVTPGEATQGLRDLNAPVSNALVSISDGMSTYVLVEDTSEIPNVRPKRTNHGTYRLSAQDSMVITSDRTYELVAVIPNLVVRASTKTPTPITVTALSTIVNHPAENVRLSMTKDSTIGGYLIVTAIDYSQPINFDYGGYNYLYSSSSEVVIPWKHFLTLGVAKIYVYAFDRNYDEYVRNRKLGNPTQSLYELEDVIENGVGIFASAALDSITVSVQ